MRAEIRLVDLEVIRRFSLAVRQDTAPAEEVLAALDASRQTVVAALARGGGPSPRPAKATKATKTTKTAKPAKATKTAKPAKATKAAKPAKAGSGGRPQKAGPR